MRRLAAACLFAIFGLAAASPAEAKRVALVIGINTYDNFKPSEQLRKAVNDARAVSSAFRELGFQVITAEDPSRNAFFRAWQRFLDAVQPGDEAALYFAGHGIEINGTNFLLARDVPQADDGQEVLRNSAIAVSSLMERLRDQRPQVSVVIIDACRNNPYEARGIRRSVGSVRGLTREEPPKGTLMMMSAGTGQAALDALSLTDPHPNSVYTRVLVPLMKEPGLEITDLAKRVRTEVEALAGTIGHDQRPAFYHELSGNFFLVSKQVAVSAALQPPQTPAAPAADPVVAWAAVKDSTSPAVLEAFIAEFATTVYGGFARARLEELRKARIAELTPASRPSAVPVAPPSIPLKPAASASARPSSVFEAAQAWAAARESTSAAVLEDFGRQFAGTFYADLARSRLDELKRSQVAVVAPPVAPVAPPLATPAVGISSDERKPLSEADERALKPQDAFKECPTCPDMVVVPAGTFVMGSPDGEEGRSHAEGPQHQVKVARAFAVGRFAVTFDEWEACLAGGGCNGYLPADLGRRRGRHPVMNVSWDDAQAYVAWLSKVTGKRYRLLTEAEREYATRAGTTTPFWFGATISARQANYDGRTIYAGGAPSDFRERILPADALAPNPFGLYHVHGNIYEWVEDCFVPGYRGAPLDSSARHAVDCRVRGIRGGSWLDDPQLLRAAARAGLAPGQRISKVGFRVARSL
jgi:formylglycine-generating enzyme required for sulfatase activity